MKIGEGDAWVGVLVGGLFMLLLLPLLLVTSYSLIRRLVRGARALVGGRAYRSGLDGMVGSVRSELLLVLVFAFFGTLSTLIFLISLVNYVPVIGAWPPVTGVLAVMLDATQAQRELERGVREENSGLMRAALALGADARNSAHDQSLLAQLSNPDSRQLLIEHGASPDGMPHQKAPLEQAWERRDLPLFRWLLQAGAETNPRMSEGSQHIIQALAQSQPALSDQWLQALLDQNVDLNRRSASGLSVLDALTLTTLRPDWRLRLQESGARHGVPMDRGKELPTNHPAITHVRQWLDARGGPQWKEGDARWELPGASETGIYYFLPVKEIQLRGRVDGNEALVAASGPAGGGLVRTTQVLVRRIQAESNELPAGVSQTHDEFGPGSWRIAGFWLDERQKVP